MTDGRCRNGERAGGRTRCPTARLRLWHIQPPQVRVQRPRAGAWRGLVREQRYLSLAQGQIQDPYLILLSELLSQRR